LVKDRRWFARALGLGRLGLARAKALSQISKGFFMPAKVDLGFMARPDS
jgi:hypothetical protein